MTPGQLPPGAVEQLDYSLASWRETGLVIGVRILPGPDCPCAAAEADRIFLLETPPALPVEGCVRKPCCACCFVAVLDDEIGPDTKVWKVVSGGWAEISKAASESGDAEEDEE